MANIRQIKRRIKSATNTSKITKAMEMVAASKMKRAQNKALQARPYAQAIQRSLRKVAANTDASSHPLLQLPKTGKACLVIISTNKGLCGSLNTNLFKQAAAWQKTHGSESTLVVVGKKAVHFAQLYGADIYAQFTDIPENFTNEDVLAIAQLLIDGFSEGTFKSVDVLYTDFINTLSQKTTLNQLLPIFDPEAIPTQETVETISTTSEYTFEPNIVTLLETLLPFYVENTVFQLMLEASASEHSARMVAMKNASENAHSMVGDLKLLYNKSRQEQITGELLEITTATMTLS